MKGKARDLGVRTFINGISAILIALFIFLAHHPAVEWLFAAAVVAIGGIAVWEYNNILKKKELIPASVLSLVAVILYLSFVFLKTVLNGGLGIYWVNLAPQLILWATFLGCFIYCAAKNIPPIVNVGTTFLGIIYIAIPLSLLIKVMYFFGKNDPQAAGSWWIIYLIAVTKSADIGGYFIGSYFGEKKLAHKLSPNKTVEGALGGLVASLVASVFICYLGRYLSGVFEKCFLFQAFVLGLFLGILGQIGDLTESFLKRDAGVKDSNTIPGVGGVLDMIDSLLFTTPVVYLFLRIAYDYHH